MKMFKKYLVFIVAALLIVISFFWRQDIGVKAVNTILSSGKEMLLILPPVFIMLGLLDVWVPRDKMVKYMGEDSGIVGALLSIIIGSAAAGPLYVVFPIAAAFMKKDVKFTNILLLIGAWSTTKIPMLMFELSALGSRFMLTRLAMNIPVILIITFAMNRSLSKTEIDAIYRRSKENAQ